MNRIAAALSVVALLCACGQSTPADRSAGERTGTPAVNAYGILPGGSKAPIAEFASRAAVADLFAIQAGKSAQQRAADPRVKAFADRMLAEHTRSADGLRAALAAGAFQGATPSTLPADKQAMIAALSAAPPGQFDRLYLDQQKQVLEEALAAMKGYANNGDVAQVETFASQTAPVVQMQLDAVNALLSAPKS